MKRNEQRVLAILAVALLVATASAGCLEALFNCQVASGVSWETTGNWNVTMGPNLSMRLAMEGLPLQAALEGNHPRAVGLTMLAWEPSKEGSDSVAFKVSAPRGLTVNVKGPIPGTDILRLLNDFLDNITRSLPPADAAAWVRSFHEKNGPVLDQWNSTAPARLGPSGLSLTPLPDQSPLYSKVLNDPDTKQRRSTRIGFGTIEATTLTLSTPDGWALTLDLAAREARVADGTDAYVSVDPFGGTRVEDVPTELGKGDRLKEWAADAAVTVGLPRPDTDGMAVWTTDCSDD